MTAAGRSETVAGVAARGTAGVAWPDGAGAATGSAGAAVSIRSLAEATADANAIWAGSVEWELFSVSSTRAAKAIPGEAGGGPLAAGTAGYAGSATGGALGGAGGLAAMSESS